MPVWRSPETRARVIRLIRSVTTSRTCHRLTHIAVRLVAAAKSSADERAVGAVADEIDRKGAESVAAVLMEPNAGTNGIVAPDNYWPGLREVTRSRGVFLIADEVMSAFGRCGEWFAWQRYGDAGKPDLMTLAKGLTGAHVPLGAVVSERKCRPAFRNADAVYRPDLQWPSPRLRRRTGGGSRL